MLYPLSILSLLLLVLIHLTQGHDPQPQYTIHSSFQAGLIPLSIREHWIRRANAALASPCPFAPFGTVIVNHSDTSTGPYGKEICYAVNENFRYGNPTLHGEISGINNCSRILTDPGGPYGLSSGEALEAFRELSLYTNAEPCPMCASAIWWSGFAECIFRTSIETLIAKGWDQISLSAEELFEETEGLPSRTVLIGNVLTEETDPWFSWQFDKDFKCPKGCERGGDEGQCVEKE